MNITCRTFSINRTLLVLSISSALLLFWTACSRTLKIDHPLFRWESVGPTADSILCVLDSAFILADYPRLSSAIDSLAHADSILHKAPATLYYWRMRDAQRRRISDSASYWLRLALKYADPQERPYERNRIRLFQAFLSSSKFQQYLHLDTALTYFEKSGDSFMTADCYIHLSNIFNEIGDSETSMRYLRRAMNLYQKMNIRPYAYKSELNLATQLLARGDSTEARKRFINLVNDPYTRSDTNFYTLVMEDAYNLLRADSLLLRFYNLSRLPAASPIYARNASYLMSLSPHVASNPDSALFYSSMAVRHQRRCRKSHATAMIWNRHADALLETGNIQEAISFKNLAFALKDSLCKADSQQQIVAMHAKSQIEHLKLNKEWNEKRSRLIFIIIVTLLALASLICISLLYRRNVRLKLSSAQSSLDLERNRRILGQAILSIDEKNKVIDRLSDMTDAALNKKTLRRMRLNEKRIDGDLQHLQMLYDSVSSRLIVRLKEKAPSISPSMQQLAVLLVCGLDSKEIANIMNITPESVKKARYRLRKLLAVDHTQNLTAILNQMAAH